MPARGHETVLKGERCYTEKCAIEKRNFLRAARQGSQAEDRRLRSPTREKQKARRYYQLLEGQFRNLYEKAWR